MMSCAVTGPMPSIVSSCSTVAVPRLIGPSSSVAPTAASGAAAGPRFGTTTCCPSASRAARLIASSSAPPAGAAGALHRIGHPRSRRQPVDAGPGHRPGDVDHDVTARAAVDGEPFVATARGERRDRAAIPLRPDRPRPEQQQRDCDGAVDGDLRPAQLGHEPNRAAERGARVARTIKRLCYRSSSS